MNLNSLLNCPTSILLILCILYICSLPSVERRVMQQRESSYLVEVTITFLQCMWDRIGLEYHHFFLKLGSLHAWDPPTTPQGIGRMNDEGRDTHCMVHTSGMVPLWKAEMQVDVLWKLEGIYHRYLEELSVRILWRLSYNDAIRVCRRHPYMKGLPTLCLHVPISN